MREHKKEHLQIELENLVFAAACAMGIALIWMIWTRVVASARRLDERIEQYHEEGPPADPFSEFAKIIEEDEKSKRHPKSKSRPGGQGGS